MGLLARHLLLRRCTAAALTTRGLTAPPPLLPSSPPRHQPPPLLRRTTMSAAGGGDGAGVGAKKQAQAPEVDAIALFTGPGADHLRVQSCSIHGCSALSFCFALLRLFGVPLSPNTRPTARAASFFLSLVRKKTRGHGPAALLNSSRRPPWPLSRAITTPPAKPPQQTKQKNNSETPPVPKDELPRLLAALPAWRLSSDGATLSRAFVARNFLAALAFLQRVGEVAEHEGHHPDLHLTNYRDVEVVVATHEGGARVTMADLVLAAKIDALPAEYSPKWLREQAAARAKGA